MFILGWFVVLKNVVYRACNIISSSVVSKAYALLQKENILLLKKQRRFLFDHS